MIELLKGFLLVSLLALPVLLVVRVTTHRLASADVLRLQRLLFVGLAVLPLFAPWLGSLGRGFASGLDVAVLSVVPLKLDLMLDAAVRPGGGGSALSFADLLALAWLAGAAVLLLVFCRDQLRYRRLAGRAVPLDPEALPVTVPASVSVRVSSAKTSAFVSGLFRPVIVLPADLTAGQRDLSLDDGVAAVLMHELAHLAHRDTIWLPLCRLLLSLSWPVLPLWLLYRDMTLQAELAADAQALQGTDQAERRLYATRVIQAMQHTSPSPAGLPAFTSHHLRRARMRIRHIMSGPRAPSTRAHRRIARLAAGLLILPLAGIQIAIANADFDFLAPLVEGELTSGYGERPNPFTGEMAHHNGIDIKAPLGAPVLAPARGEVVFAGVKNDRYGIVVELLHPAGFRSFYAHLQATELNVGDTVAEGAPIGHVGVTGDSTGPHVHVELYQDGTRVDPQAYLPVSAEDAYPGGE